MRIEVVPTVEEIRTEQIRNRVVIVIDVLRASSTIVTALGSGFSAVIPVGTIGQALSRRSPGTLVAGERHCRKIPECDFNNSPAELAAQKPQGRQLILTTTNGTRAIQKAERAAHLLIGCFLNATACIRHAISQGLDITLYCAGTRGEFALEDGLAAGLMIERAQTEAASVQLCDLGTALQASYRQLAGSLEAVLPQTATGRRLVQHRLTEDLAYCAQVDRFQLVPYAEEKRILPRLVS